MATMNDVLRNNFELISRIPDGQHFDLSPNGFEFQCYDQASCAALRKTLPHGIWKKEFVVDCGWWAYTMTYKGIGLRIYACREAPKTCKAIFAEKQVVERVATGYTDRVVTKQVIVGWDCGGKKEKKSA